MADTTTIITITTIIFCEFPENADFYYGFIHLAWGGGYIFGPIIMLLAYDSIGYTGIFFLLSGIISVGALVPAICMIPSRLNTNDESDDKDEKDLKSVNYCDFFKSYRSMTILIISLLGITPLIYVDGTLAVRLMAMGMTEA
jgi:MFS family permease